MRTGYTLSKQSEEEEEGMEEEEEEEEEEAWKRRRTRRRRRRRRHGRGAGGGGRRDGDVAGVQYVMCHIRELAPHLELRGSRRMASSLCCSLLRLSPSLSPSFRLNPGVECRRTRRLCDRDPLLLPPPPPPPPPTLPLAPPAPVLGPAAPPRCSASNEVARLNAFPPSPRPLLLAPPPPNRLDIERLSFDTFRRRSVVPTAISASVSSAASMSASSSSVCMLEVRKSTHSPHNL
jgi:hypothetical protein